MTPKNKLVCFDSSVFKYIFRDKKPPRRSKDIPVDYIVEFEKAQTLYKRLTKLEYRILVPSIVLSESACILSPDDQNKFFSKLDDKNILVGDFTLSTSRILAKILHMRYYKEDRSHKSHLKIDKSKMKYDSLILAIAEEWNCDALYTTDGDLGKYYSKVAVLSMDENPPGLFYTDRIPLESIEEEE